MKIFYFVVACLAIAVSEAYVDYTGHKVIRVLPKSEAHLELLLKLREDYSVDLWNEPRYIGTPVMTHLRPELIEPVERFLNEKNIEYDVAHHNLQSAIDAEKALHAPTNVAQSAEFDFSKYNTHERILQLLQDLSSKHSNIATLETIGKSFENRAIHSLKISSGNNLTKPVIMIECGIHAREWSAIAAGAYIVNKLTTTYGSDPEVTSLVDNYEFHIVVEANPDGYVYTWTHDRYWRKTRSRSTTDWLGTCRGVDANRNFDIEHCGVGTKRRPCKDTFCGDRPFSESETRALRDMMIQFKDRMKAYFTLHAYSQLWMTPYGFSKKLPSNYAELIRVGQAGVSALTKKYGTRYKLGSIANTIYEVSGSSVDYAYEKQGIKMAHTLELRDTGSNGFTLGPHEILPMCDETFDGLKAAIQAL